MKVQIYFLSRNPAVICAIAIVILAIGFGVAWWLNGTRRFDSGDEFSEDAIVSLTPLDSLKEQLDADDANAHLERIGQLLFALHRHPYTSWRHNRSRDRQQIDELIAKSKLTPADRQLFEALWDSLTSVSGEPNAILLTLAYRHRLPNANGFVARLYLRKKNSARALFFLHREAVFAKSEAARKQEIALLFKKRDFEHLDAISRDSRYEKQWNAQMDVFVASHRGEWMRAAVDCVQSDFDHIPPAIAALVTLSGVVWLIILLQAIQMPEAPLSRLTLCLLGVVLGFFSTTPTLLLVMFTENNLHLVLGKGLITDLLYCFAGIGPREEFCKLAAFLPLLPTLMLRKNKLEMLIVAGCVGLGFAVSENLEYFGRGMPTLAIGRFVTANFMHIAATGILGLALCEACLEPLKYGWKLPLTFLWVSTLHALYDAVQIIPILTVLHFMEGVSFIWLTIVFFKRLRQWRAEETNYFWMPASIITGLAIVSAACFIYASWFMGMTAAGTALFVTAIEVGMFIYLLVWQAGNLRKDAAV